MQLKLLLFPLLTRPQVGSSDDILGKCAVTLTVQKVIVTGYIGLSGNEKQATVECPSSLQARIFAGPAGVFFTKIVFKKSVGVLVRLLRLWTTKGQRATLRGSDQTPTPPSNIYYQAVNLLIFSCDCPSLKSTTIGIQMTLYKLWKKGSQAER